MWVIHIITHLSTQSLCLIARLPQVCHHKKSIWFLHTHTTSYSHNAEAWYNILVHNIFLVARLWYIDQPIFNNIISKHLFSETCYASLGELAWAWKGHKVMHVQVLEIRDNHQFLWCDLSPAYWELGKWPRDLYLNSRSGRSYKFASYYWESPRSF